VRLCDPGGAVFSEGLGGGRGGAGAVVAFPVVPVLFFPPGNIPLRNDGSFVMLG